MLYISQNCQWSLILITKTFSVFKWLFDHYSVQCTVHYIELSMSSRKHALHTACVHLFTPNLLVHLYGVYKVERPLARDSKSLVLITRSVNTSCRVTFTRRVYISGCNCSLGVHCSLPFVVRILVCAVGVGARQRVAVRLTRGSEHLPIRVKRTLDSLAAAVARSGPLETGATGRTSRTSRVSGPRGARVSHAVAGQRAAAATRVSARPTRRFRMSTTRNSAARSQPPAARPSARPPLRRRFSTGVDACHLQLTASNGRVACIFYWLARVSSGWRANN